MSPRNPIGPVSAVTVPVSTLPATKPMIIVRVVATPRAAAHSSPTASRFQSRAFLAATATTVNTRAASQATVVYSTASIDPISQRSTANDWLKSAMLCRNRMAAEQTLLMVTPASRSVKEDILRPCEARAVTSRSAVSAPTKAASHTPDRIPDGRKPRQMAATAPSEAPPATPST